MKVCREMKSPEVGHAEYRFRCWFLMFISSPMIQSLAYAPPYLSVRGSATPMMAFTSRFGNWAAGIRNGLRVEAGSWNAGVSTQTLR